MPTKRLLARLKLGASRFHSWKLRYATRSVLPEDRGMVHGSSHVGKRRAGCSPLRFALDV